MTTPDLYDRLLASTIAQIYLELSNSPQADDRAEAAVVRAAGIANCGETDFDLLVKELAE